VRVSPALFALLEQPGRVWTREELAGRLYADGVALHSNAIEVHVHALRRKLAPALIQSARGVGYLGLNPFRCKNPTVFIIADTIELYPEEMYLKGLKLITASTQRTDAAAVSPSIKSLNYLNNILAKIEAVNAGVVEAIMLNGHGHVAECTADNVFIVRNGKLETPPVSAGALNGITRQLVMELAAKRKIAVSEPNLSRYDLTTADEVFITGTAAEIVPVANIDGRTIGSGRPGPLTLKLTEDFRKLTRSEGTPIGLK